MSLIKQYSVGAIAAVLLAGAFMVSPAQAQTQADEVAEALATIQLLLQQVEALQEQLRVMRGEVREVREEIRTTLREGMNNEEVRRLQELLATDPDIYPEGFVTGFYGGLTRQALVRLQQRHRLPATGEVDEATRELLNEYFSQREAGTVPPGLLRAPGIVNAVERGVCDRGRGARPFCPTPTAEEDKKEEGDKETEDKKEDVEKDDRTPADKDEKKVDEAAPVAADKAAAAVRGAQRAIDVVAQAIRTAPRAADVTEAREYLQKAQSSYNDARRAYNAREYRKAYDAAVESRRFANRAFASVPDRTFATQRGQELQDRYQSIQREYGAVEDKDKKDDDVLRTCGLDTFKALVGERIADRADVIARWERYHNASANNRSVRFLNPGDAMTMDYVETRLNVFFDEDGVVEKVSCG